MARRHGASLPEDVVVLVDERDVQLGYAAKEKCHSVHDGIPGYHHRGLTVLVYNPRGEVLLQRRKHRVFDGVWDLAGSTHPYFRDGRQESYEEAAKRCLATEYSGLAAATAVNSSVFVNYAAIDPLDRRYCENEFCRLVLASHEGTVRHLPNYAYEHTWSPLRELEYDVSISPSRYAPWVVDLLQEIEKKRPRELFALS